MALEKHGPLTRVETRTVIALNSERIRLTNEIQEVDAAIQAQIVAAAERQQLPPDRYVVMQSEDGVLCLARQMPDGETAKAE